MRIGIYGGSFNPIHNGHVHVAETAAAEFSLDKVIFVPSKISPHRSSDEYIDGKERIKLIKLAVKGKKNMSCSDWELSQERVSYSVYTVKHFRERYPDAELFLLVGSDMLLSFDSWFCFEEILDEASLIVVSRHGGDMHELEAKAEELRKYGNIFISKSTPLEISSSEIRKKIAKNEDFACYLNESVVQYISKMGHYKKEAYTEMYKIDDKKKYLKENLSAKRYQHSLNVAAECKKLAEKYGEDPDKAYFAGLLHDICKELPAEEQRSLVIESGFTVCREELETRSLLHGIAGAYFIKKEYGVADIDILNAVRFHTVGRAGMSRLEEIVYLGDLVSAERDYKDVDKMRKLVYTDLNEAMLYALAFSIRSVLKKGGLIPPCTIEAYNFYTRLIKEEKEERSAK